MDNKPLILVTNDDGIHAEGIRVLIELMNQMGEVWVVAPENSQSGMGHAITINATLHVDRRIVNNGPQIEYSCSGTPVDCVKIAINELLPKKPDLCVSGINHGQNASTNIIYSGTMSAAVEAGIQGIPSAGFSLCDSSWNADFQGSQSAVNSISKLLLQNKLPPGVVLNVNIPKSQPKDIKGIKICRGADASWHENFDKRKNPQGREYYWLTGDFINQDRGKDTDLWALENNYVSVVPVHYDLTAHDVILEIKTWSL